MIEEFKKMIQESNSIVFFGGAGVSTDSGIPDFRSKEGLSYQNNTLPIETLLSHHFFMNFPKDFYHYYKENLLHLDALPNSTHHYLCQLEKEGKLSAIVTQNIDGLHQLAGSTKVLELHGNARKYYCMKCHKEYSVEAILQTDIPTCQCGGIIRPEVVLYQESLNENIINEAISAIKNCDMLIIAGTSLHVYPAAGFIQYYQGNKLVVMNKSPLKVEANLVFQESMSDIFEQLLNNQPIQ